MSDAVLLKIVISWDWREIQPLEADPASDVHAKIALFYRNADYFEAIFIPSPKASLFESEGIYTGIRGDPLQPAMAPWTTDAPTTLANITTEEGEPFPTLFVVSGLMI